jgi:hypothetical protein
MRWSDSSAVKGGLPVSRRPAFKEKNSREDQQAPAFTPLLIELVHRIRGSFSTLKGLAEISRDKFREKNYGEYYTRVVTEEIARTESVLACFIDYLRINTPLQKQNTVHKLIEQALRRNDLALQEKRIRVTRKFESDIPETAVHDDQLTYILSSLVQHAVTLTSFEGTLGILTKVLSIQEVPRTEPNPEDSDGGFVEILIAFTRHPRSPESFQNLPGLAAPSAGETDDLILQLVRMIIQRNRGSLKFRFDQAKKSAYISLKLPVERRKTFVYHTTPA